MFYCRCGRSIVRHIHKTCYASQYGSLALALDSGLLFSSGFSEVDLVIYHAGKDMQSAGIYNLSPILGNAFLTFCNIFIITLVFRNLLEYLFYISAIN